MDVNKIAESLSPNERKVIPYLEEKDVNEICRKSHLDKTSVLRVLRYLQSKGLVKVSVEKKKVIEIGVNGALYKKKGLPERRLLNLLDEKRIVGIEDAQKESGLSNDEFKAALGMLKRKALIDVKNQKIILSANKEEIAKKTLEELFIEALPLEYDSLSPEQLHALKSLQNRKNIILIKDKNVINIEITDLGKKMVKEGVDKKELIEQVTSDILKKESQWRGKKFRRYNVESPVSEINGGKRHFVNQATDYGRKVWTEMGFKEMTGNMIESCFWVFDALFTPQDHPVREMQDTFFINHKREISDKKLLKEVKKAHEPGVGGSKGWQYNWSEEEAEKLVLRTHTTCLSSKKLAELNENEMPAKFFALGKCFRNETVDWSHGFEFYQTEGIVVDPKSNFRNLLGYLKQFFKKMGYEKIRFRPAYFPYTEPSVEIDVWHSEKKVWLELGGAGIFRPEVVIPLLGKNIPVLAWGPGFGRMLMGYYGIQDLRELYKNDLNKLRKMKFWMK
jgi:phenylalanyl-tRNA synthetase alpha chain